MHMYDIMYTVHGMIVTIVAERQHSKKKNHKHKNCNEFEIRRDERKCTHKIIDFKHELLHKVYVPCIEYVYVLHLTTI